MQEDQRLNYSEERDRQRSEADNDETGKVRTWLRLADQMNNIAPDESNEKALIIEMIRPLRRKSDGPKPDKEAA